MPEYELVRFFLEIKRDVSDGSMKTGHYPASEQDKIILDSWPSGGLVQSSHAFMIEALKRETYTMAIAMMSGGIPRENIKTEDLAPRVINMTLDFANNFCGDISKKTIEMLHGEV